MIKTILKKDFIKRSRELNEEYTLIAPVNDNNIWDFKEITELNIPEIEYGNSVLSPKKIVFPQKEVLFGFYKDTKKNFSIIKSDKAEKKKIVFGIRPCDAMALSRLDIFFKNDYEDNYYSSKKESLILIGLSCNFPHSINCFCTSVGGSPFSSIGLDILMTDLENKYVLEAISEKGIKLMNFYSTVFNEYSPEDEKKQNKLRSDSLKKIKKKLDNLSTNSKKLEKSFNLKMWEDESMSCIRCGICTYLCPSCHCYDINDEVINVFPLKGQRVRTWDNCQFPDFTMHSSGHNPRSNRASRLRQRVLHKFLYFVKNFNEFLCTGCGRCISKCPVEIDIVEVLKKATKNE